MSGIHNGNEHEYALGPPAQRIEVYIFLDATPNTIKKKTMLFPKGKT